MALRSLAFTAAFSSLVSCSGNKTQGPATGPETASQSQIQDMQEQGTTLNKAPTSTSESLMASVSDGSGNRYEFSVVRNAEAYVQGRVVYSPVQPEESSSGIYSGGEAFDRELTSDRSSDIWSTLLNLQGNSDIHVQARSMGTGRITISSPAGNERFLVQSGPDFDKLIRLLRDETKQ